MNKKLIRLTESDLHRIVKKSVNKILKEYREDEYSSGALTVGELIEDLQKLDPNEFVEVYVGNRTYKNVTNVDGYTLFVDGRDYKEWKQEQELDEPRGNVIGDDYGEGF